MLRARSGGGRGHILRSGHGVQVARTAELITGECRAVDLSTERSGSSVPERCSAAHDDRRSVVPQLQVTVVHRTLGPAADAS